MPLLREVRMLENLLSEFLGEAKFGRGKKPHRREPDIGFYLPGTELDAILRTSKKLQSAIRDVQAAFDDLVSLKEYLIDHLVMRDEISDMPRMLRQLDAQVGRFEGWQWKLERSAKDVIKQTTAFNKAMEKPLRELKGITRKG